MPTRRRLTIGLLAAFMLFAILVLGSLNAFNLGFLKPASTEQSLLFTALSALVFLLLVFVVVLFSRNVLKLYADQRSRLLGSRIRTRLLTGALILSFAPTLVMFLFNYGLMNRSMDRWLSQPVTQLRENSMRVAVALSQYAAANARAEAASIALLPQLDRSLARLQDPAMLALLRKRHLTLQGGFVLIYTDGQPVIEYQVPSARNGFAIDPWMDAPWMDATWMDATSMDAASRERGQVSEALPGFLLTASRRSDQPVISIGSDDYILGAGTTTSGRIVVVGLPMPAGLRGTVQEIRSDARDYWTLFRQRNRIRSTYLLVMLLLTTLTFFASSWLALFLAKQVTQPVEALADAMDKIAAGNYAHRVTLTATEELGQLIQSFNSMAADLEQSRTLAESSTAQLSEANRSVEERRHELETILETMPNGVVTLDTQLRVLQANRAFLELFEFQPEMSVGSMPLELIFPAELSEELRRLLRRSQRMGVASAELDFQSPRGPLRLSATVALLQLGRERRGYVLVLEDVTEFLRAQRQVAWKEVAQRIAHEIKNPLTPISLSAERIRKHVEHPVADSPAVIRKCSDVILSSVNTMRTLVDQFAALAQFPASAPRVVSLNAVMEAALLPFAGRLEDIRLEQQLAPDLPPVLADPEALRRALTNLIDNAAEAMQVSLLRHLTLSTGWNETRTMAEIVVADTGHGITHEIRERLFLPYFSTKGRGTGLGLAIAAKIVQEHHGSIRAEQNLPAGTRFIVEIPFADTAAAEAVALPAAESAPR